MQDNRFLKDLILFHFKQIKIPINPINFIRRTISKKFFIHLKQKYSKYFS